MAVCGAKATSPEVESGFSVGIIGAGVAGLQQAQAFRERGVQVTIFERASAVGGVWRENYTSFGVQVPAQLYEFPDFPYRKQSACADVCGQEYPEGADVQAYINRYADHYDLRKLIQFDTKVVNVVPREATSAGAGWTFTVARGGKTFKHHFSYAVVATGMYSASPFLPRLEGAKAFVEAGGKIIHSSEYREGPMLEGKRVLVLGGAKSAIDIAIHATKRSNSVRATSRAARARRRWRGRAQR